MLNKLFFLSSPEVPEKPEEEDENLDMVTSSGHGSVCGSTSQHQELVRDLISFDPDTEEISDVAILTRPLWNHHSIAVKRKEENAVSFLNRRKMAFKHLNLTEV